MRRFARAGSRAIIHRTFLRKISFPQDFRPLSRLAAGESAKERRSGLSYGGESEIGGDPRTAWRWFMLPGPASILGQMAASRLTERDGWGSVILSSFQSCEPEAGLRRQVLALKSYGDKRDDKYRKKDASHARQGRARGRQNCESARGKKGQARRKRLRQAFAAVEGARGRGRLRPFAAYRGGEQSVALSATL